MPESPTALESGDRYLRWFSSFWVVNAGGWLALAVFTYTSFTLPYEQQSLPYVVHPFLQSAIGFALTGLMRQLFRGVWHWSPGFRITLAVFASLFFSALWTGLRLATFIAITGEELNMRLTLPSWYYPGLLTFSLWTALYHALKYLRMLRAEHANLLRVQAQRNEELLRRTRAESVARDAQLRMLRYQLNPHFLFNTLNSIAALVTAAQNRTATTMIYQLSQFLRYSLDSDQIPFVTVAQELEALRLYLDIEKVRFGDRLRVEFDEAPEVADVPVPGLILQPLVENALKYAIATDEEGGSIRISARREGDRLCVTIDDSGPGFSDGQQSFSPQGVGLRNVRERLLAVYGDDQCFEIGNAPHGGARARMTMPLSIAGEPKQKQEQEQEQKQKQKQKQEVTDDRAYHAVG